MCDVQCDPVEALTRLIREEAGRLLALRMNWKLTVNGSAGGDVRVVTEVYRTVLRSERRVAQTIDSLPQ
jgi:hypothetical protein